MADEALPFGEAALPAFEEYRRFRARIWDERTEAVLVDLVAHGSAALETTDEGELRRIDPADLNS
jgi:hypothetical protein